LGKKNKTDIACRWGKRETNKKWVHLRGSSRIQERGERTFFDVQKNGWGKDRDERPWQKRSVKGKERRASYPSRDRWETGEREGPTPLVLPRKGSARRLNKKPTIRKKRGNTGKREKTIVEYPHKGE